MKTFEDSPLSGNLMVYIINDEDDDTDCFSLKHYEENKEKYIGKVLIIAHENVPVYFRKG